MVRARQWSAAEDARLGRMIRAKASWSEIEAAFHDRGRNACRSRLTILRADGRIPPCLSNRAQASRSFHAMRRAAAP